MNFIQKTLVKWFIPEPKELFPIIVKWLAELWEDNKDKVTKEIYRAIRKTFMGETATVLELEELRDAVERLVKTSEFTFLVKKVQAVVTK
jgi:hypothetical protein